MLDGQKKYRERFAPWLFILLYSLSLLGFSLLAIQFDWPDSLLIVFIIPILFAAFYFCRWVSWYSLALLLFASTWVTWNVSLSFERALRTLITAALCELVIIEVIFRLTQFRRDAKKELQNSQQKYQLLIEQLPIGVYRTDEDGTILHANLTLAKMLGFNTAEALIERHKAQDFYVDPQHIDLQRKDYLENDIRTHELQLCRQDGCLVWVHDTAHAIFDKAGNVLYVDGTLEDISERKKMAEELSHDRNLLRTLIDNLPDRIYVKNLQGQKVLSNPADWISLGASSEEEVLHKTDFEFVSEELAKGYWSDDQHVLQGNPVINRVERAPEQEGEQRWILTSKMPLYDAEEQIIGLVGVGRDITERRQIEEALHKANEKLTKWVGELEQRNHEAKLLNDMGELLQSCHSMEDAYEVIGKFAGKLFEQQSGELYILNNSRNLLEMVTFWDGPAMKNPPPHGERVASSNDCWALRRGRVHLIEEPDNHLRCKHLGKKQKKTKASKKDNFFPFICVPMAAQGETLGMMHIRFDNKVQVRQEEQLVIAVAERCALALANLRLGETLRAQAVRDPLTGLFNRRYMEETLEREIRRAIRYQRALGVIMLDIDYFKNFNDTFSYAAGDTLLRELGTMLKANLRADDVICRYGGEEFILILPESNLKDTARRAEQIRKACTRMHVYHREQPLGLVTISLGVAAYPEHGKIPEDLLRAVDTALHHSKAGGRDQVTIAGIAQKST